VTPIDHTATSTHPLDPLSPDELERSVVALRRAGLAELGSRVISVDLLEPDKAALRVWREGGAVPEREALAVVLEIGGEARECTIALDGDTITGTRSLAGMQPAVSMDEYFEAGAACRRDSGYREALARRGIEGDQVELVHIEPWTVGSFEQGPRRMARCLSWLRSSLDDVNPYGRPPGGLVALVDLTEMRVLRIDDHGTLPVPDGDWDYRGGGGDGFRDDQRPIEITQPQGPSFTLHGRELRWQRWRLRVGFSHRESLVLH
jgi:primary-amine oxidase